MNSTDFFFLLGDIFQWTFQIFEIIGNAFNYFLIILGFGGFFYWMNIQRKLNNAADVPIEVEDSKEWYKDSSKNRQIK